MGRGGRAVHPGLILAGRYRLDRPLGRGPTPTLWVARDGRLQRDVAVEVIPAGSAGPGGGRPLGGASAAASLRSPHLIEILDVGRDRDRGFVVMELVTGPTLRGLLGRRGALPAVVVAAIGSQLGRGLHTAHRAGVAHGEIAPSDILVAAPSGLLKLGGFVSTAPDGGTRFADAETLRYTAPERLAGAGESPTDDLYALGLVLWECLVGRPAFDADTVAASATARLRHEPEPIRAAAPHVPGLLADVVTTLTRRRPEDRPWDALEVARRLEEVAGNRPWGWTADLVAGYPVDHTREETRAFPAPAGADGVGRSDRADRDEDEERALRLATVAFTQAVTDAADAGALRQLADGRAPAWARARQLLGTISRDDAAAHDRAAQLLTQAEQDTGTRGDRRPQVPVDDPDRLRTLDASGLLDSPIEEVFDRATRLAGRLLGTPVSLVSIVDGDRQFFKSQVGLPEPWASARETPLSHSFCRYVAETDHTLSVTDARRHPLVADNAAIDSLDVISYLGVPLRDGTAVVGSFCVISDRPRDWTADDLSLLGDIAAIVQRELDVRAAAVQLARQAREAHESMAMLAHDLRAPLGVIAGGVQTIRRLPHASDGPFDDLLDAMERQAERTLGVASALLQAEDGAPPDGQAVPVGRLVRHLMADGVLPESAASRVTVDIPADLLVLAEPVLVEQIVVNLVANALAHTDGSVQVSGRRHGHGSVELRIADHGPGLSPEELDGLTQPHVRGEGSAGWGLGLAIVRRFVDRLGGDLRVDADDGRDGTVFTVTLPAHPGRPAQGATGRNGP